MARQYDELPIGVAVVCILEKIAAGKWYFDEFLKIFEGEFATRKAAVKSILKSSRSNEQTPTAKNEFKTVKSTFTLSLFCSYVLRGHSNKCEGKGSIIAILSSHSLLK